MNELKVTKSKIGLTVDSRDVSEMVGKEHSNLMRDIRGYAEVLDKPDSILKAANFFNLCTYLDTQGQARPCYLLTRKGCDMVANKMTGEKGVLFTAAYVTKFEEMENDLRLQPKDSYMIADPIERAKAWIVEAEQTKTLALQLEAQHPKVIFADSVATSKTSILIGELAKIIKGNGVDIGEKRFFTWLRDNKFLISRKGTDYNAPTQKSMELNLFRVKETVITHSDGHISINKTTKVTGKGQIYFVSKFKTSLVLA